MAATRTARRPQARQTRDAQRYLQALFGREQAGALIEVRYRHRDRMRRDFFAHSDTYAAARRILRLGLRTDVYVGVAPRHTIPTSATDASTPTGANEAISPAGGKDAISRLWALWADLDDPDARDALDGLPVAPAIVIASGTPGHLHAYWPLQVPVSTPVAEAANRRLAAHLGADTGAVTNAATILRPPGTYSFKSVPPTPVTLQRLQPQLTTVYAATAALAPDPTPPPPTAPTPAKRSRRGGRDPLRLLDPGHYVSVLTGQPVGRSRKIRCPLHEDRTPSFHVYEHPHEGWYCFGCKRHGHTVYDLASALWGLQTQGEEFLQLRARLYALFLPGQSPPVAVRTRPARGPRP